MDIVEIHNFCQAVGKSVVEFVREYEKAVAQLKN